MEIMLTKPTSSPGKPDLRVVGIAPRPQTWIPTTPLAKQPLSRPSAVEPLDRRQIRLRWD